MNSYIKTAFIGNDPPFLLPKADEGKKPVKMHHRFTEILFRQRNPTF
jgi:hypothetical protein